MKVTKALFEYRRREIQQQPIIKPMEEQRPMRKLILLIAGLCVLALPVTVLAGIASSDHDMTGGGQKLCEACHIPHNALGDMLWATAPSGTFTGVQDLCYTCHDGGVTSVGVTTAFDATGEQHKAVGADCSGAGACHDVHNQNPNGTGKFTVAGVAVTNGSYCETCHDATQFTGAEALGDHTAGITHFTNGGTFTCNQCHTLHGATAQTTNPVGLTNPILLDDNEPGAFYGAFCISCHNGTAPTAAIPGTGGQASTDIFDYSMATNDGTETKHPTTSTTGGFPVEGCDKCHDVHDPAGTDFGYLLMADNANSAYCVSCHDGASGPAVGANTHYTGVPADVGMNTGLTPALPWANQVDEDGTGGADWGTATANMMICETCHSVHREGNTGLDAEYFLRHENGTAKQLCSAFHTDN
jgi:predicted CXXCH cytochrome family protein